MTHSIATGVDDLLCFTAFYFYDSFSSLKFQYFLTAGELTQIALKERTVPGINFVSEHVPQLSTNGK